MTPEVRGRTFVEEARRRQIAEAAIEVLAADGYGAASLAAIAAHIGVSKGVISYHFENKAELLREVLATVAADTVAYLTPRLTPALTATEALRTYVVANLEFLGAHPVRLLALVEVRAGARLEAGRASSSDPAEELAVAALAELIATGQHSGEFRAADPVIAARSIRAAIDVVPALSKGDPSLDLTAYAAELADFAVRALAVTPGERPD